MPALLALLRRHQSLRVSDRAIQVARRAKAWACSSPAGCRPRWPAQLPVMVAVMMGVVTGVFGGVMRDIACNEMPTAFADHRPYALCAFTGGWVYVFGQWMDWAGWQVLLVSIAVTTGLRLLALKLDWQLPHWGNEGK